MKAIARLTLTSAFVVSAGGVAKPPPASRAAVESRRPGVGSTFWFELQLPNAPRPIEIAAEPVEAKLTLPALRVLYADDQLVNRKVGERMLVRLGCTVVLAEDGAEALELANAEDFDLIVMDCHMPNVDGFEATRRLMVGRRASPPVVALTASVDEATRLACLEAGMTEVLPKPVQLSALEDVLRRWARPRSDRDAPEPARDLRAAAR